MKYEAHITVEPVEGPQFENFEIICKKHGFRVANLVMIKDRRVTMERSNRDSFATGWGDNYVILHARVMNLSDDLGVAGISVWRIKIEEMLLDLDFRPALSSGEPRVSAACSDLNGG